MKPNLIKYYLCVRNVCVWYETEICQFVNFLCILCVYSGRSQIVGSKIVRFSAYVQIVEMKRSFKNSTGAQFLSQKFASNIWKIVIVPGTDYLRSPSGYCIPSLIPLKMFSLDVCSFVRSSCVLNTSNIFFLPYPKNITDTVIFALNTYIHAISFLTESIIQNGLFLSVYILYTSQNIKYSLSTLKVLILFKILALQNIFLDFCSFVDRHKSIRFHRFQHYYLTGSVGLGIIAYLPNLLGNKLLEK